MTKPRHIWGYIILFIHVFFFSGTQNQDQTSILDENQSNAATSQIEAAEPGVEPTVSSPEPGKETQSVPDGGNDASILADSGPESENNNYVAYAADQQTNSENSLGSLDQDPGNLQKQEGGLTGHVNGNGPIANDNLLQSTSSSLLPTDDETLNEVNMAFNSQVSSSKS